MQSQPLHTVRSVTIPSNGGRSCALDGNDGRPRRHAVGQDGALDGAGSGTQIADVVPLRADFGRGTEAATRRVRRHGRCQGAHGPRGPLATSRIMASEVQGQKGHDITIAADANQHLYSKHLVNLDDLHDKDWPPRRRLQQHHHRQGRGGHYRALPWYFITGPLALRTDLIAEIGENLPDTWADVHRIGKKLKAKGHPVGFPLSHGADANGSMRAIIWSWGRQAGRGRQQDGGHQFQGDRRGAEIYQGALSGLHGGRGTRLGRPQQQRVPQFRQVQHDPQPRSAPTTRHGRTTP